MILAYNDIKHEFQPIKGSVLAGFVLSSLIFQQNWELDNLFKAFLHFMDKAQRDGGLVTTAQGGFGAQFALWSLHSPRPKSGYMTLRISLIALAVLAVFLLLLRAASPGLFRAILLVGIAIGLVSTVISLFAGLGMMTFGAATQDKASQARWTTYLMRSRVFAQGMTILCGIMLLNTPRIIAEDV